MSSKTALTLSIIIPAYNEEDHIAECLNSIKAQTTPPYEVIVVDNNSFDKTAEVATAYDFVRVVHQPRQGISHTHHAGFAAATGSHIARIDADSVLPPDWTAKVIEFYSQPQNEDSAMTGSGYFKNVHLPGLTKWMIDGMFVGTRLLLGHSSMWGPNMVIPRRGWDLIKNKTCPEKPTMYDDFDIALHLHASGVRISWLRGLRIGARIKHLNSPVRFWRYVARWPGTLKNHHDKRWVVAWAGSIILYVLQYPLLFLLRKRRYSS